MAKQLSVMPYYGGKDKLNPLIIDMLDYKNTDIYIEPFAGGARTLLNKPAHKIEIINDLSVGITTLYTVLTSESDTMNLMELLYQTEYSKESFQKALEYRNNYETDYRAEMQRREREFIREMEEKYHVRLLDDYIKEFKDNKRQEQDKKVNTIGKAVEKVWSDIHLDDEDIKRRQELLSQSIPVDYIYSVMKEIERKETIQRKWNAKQGIKEEKKKKISTSLYQHGWVDEKSDIELAAATFIVHLFSRDGIGKYFSAYKFRDSTGYYKRIDRLFECHERLKDVIVTRLDANLFFEHGGQGNLNKISVWNNEKAMVYCDPTYLPQMDADGSSMNPGSLYNNFWTEQEHNNFIDLLKDVKCKVMVSNYESKVYNRLSEEYGWKSLEVDTITTVGGNNSLRKEILWYNY